MKQFSWLWQTVSIGVCIEEGGYSCHEMGIEVKGQSRKKRQKKTWNKQVKGKCMNDGLHKDNVLC